MDIIQITSRIPIVINNRNRLTTTKNMVEKLLALNEKEHIIILDNGSEYPPLLEWYDSLLACHIMRKRVHVYFLPNLGHLALWEIEMQKLLGEYFVYTDSDIELNTAFPANWKEIMLNTILETGINKSALAIKLDDIPDHYLLKNQVMHNENRWWKVEAKRDCYYADTDTTFFMMKNIWDNQFPSVRIAQQNMICRHLPWYLDLSNLDEEERYYLDRIDNVKLTQYTKQHKESISKTV